MSERNNVCIRSHPGTLERRPGDDALRICAHCLRIYAGQSVDTHRGDLHITEGLAGQGIALSGALAVLTSLTISRLTGSLDRKWLLLGLTALMAASGVIIALASSFPVYMLGRALIGIVIGGFWSMSAATAIRLVPQRQVPRALAIFNGGNALATVVAARWAATWGPPSAGAAPFYVLSRWRCWPSSGNALACRR